jgi:uncharacterized protein
VSAPSDDRLREIYEQARTIAVVGASTSPGKPAHDIPAYLAGQGYDVIPVNPMADEVLDEEAADELSDLDGPIDIVDVFRPADEAPGIAREAVEIGARVLWLQTGIVSEEARRTAEDAGLTVVMDTCLGAAHGRLGLGPGPD